MIIGFYTCLIDGVVKAPESVTIGSSLTIFESTGTLADGFETTSPFTPADGVRYLLFLSGPVSNGLRLLVVRPRGIEADSVWVPSQGNFDLTAYRDTLSTLITETSIATLAPSADACFRGTVESALPGEAGSCFPDGLSLHILNVLYQTSGAAVSIGESLSLSAASEWTCMLPDVGLASLGDTVTCFALYEGGMWRAYPQMSGLWVQRGSKYVVLAPAARYFENFGCEYPVLELSQSEMDDAATPGR